MGMLRTILRILQQCYTMDGVFSVHSTHVV
jgi:hypothetical protein